MAKTYSFTECIVTLSHPSLGALSTNGLGLGGINIENDASRTQKSVAADGTPIMNKIKDRSGAVKLSVQQTSDLHTDLIKWFNYLETAPTSEWAKIKITAKSISTSENHVCTGCGIEKIPSKSYGATAEMVDWNFIAADVQNDVI